MQVITSTRKFQINEPTVVTIGKFDGRHKGHQKLLRCMVAKGRQQGLKSAVFTFDMAPAKVVAEENTSVITTIQERRRNMERMGIDYLVEYPFDRETAHMSPEAFVLDILCGQMNMKAIVAGPDCTFGYKGAGDTQLLEKMGPEHGFSVFVIVKEQDEHRDISSTYIREELSKGNMEKVNALLGEPYSIHGTVVHGNHIGGTILGFPTANILPPPEKQLPPFGVYVSKVCVDGQYYGGVSNIGRKPTVAGENAVGVETFILGLEGDLYGQQIEVQLLHFRRPEQKFDSLDGLKRQIEQDKEYAVSYLEKNK